MFFHIFYLFLIDSAVNSIFVAPAVTPIRDFSEPYSNNPAVRLYFYDKQDFGILVSLDGPPLPNPCRSTKGKPILFFFSHVKGPVAILPQPDRGEPPATSQLEAGVRHDKSVCDAGSAAAESAATGCALVATAQRGFRRLLCSLHG